jgi:hypothetical protein
MTVVAGVFHFEDVRTFARMSTESTFPSSVSVAGVLKV